MAPSACAAFGLCKSPVQSCAKRELVRYWKGPQSLTRDSNEHLIIMTNFELDVKLGCRHQVANRYSLLALLAFDYCVCSRLICVPAPSTFLEDSGSDSQLDFCSGFCSASSLHSAEQTCKTA